MKILCDVKQIISLTLDRSMTNSQKLTNCIFEELFSLTRHFYTETIFFFLTHIIKHKKKKHFVGALKKTKCARAGTLTQHFSKSEIIMYKFVCEK